VLGVVVGQSPTSSAGSTPRAFASLRIVDIREMAAAQAAYALALEGEAGLRLAHD